MSPSSLDGRLDDLALTIEFGIITVYRSVPEMVDQDALLAVEMLLETFQARQEGREYEPAAPDHIVSEVYNMVCGLCEWRMGSGTLIDEENDPIENTLELVSMSDVISCLRSVHRSIVFWSKPSGTRTEYLTFTSRFML